MQKIKEKTNQINQIKKSIEVKIQRSRKVEKLTMDRILRTRFKHLKFKF